MSELKITGVETILLDKLPNITYVRIHTDEGFVGLGETFFGARAVAAWIHETAAPYLLGKDALQIERHWHGLDPFVGFNSSGVENRGRSAVDIALWDILVGCPSGRSPASRRGEPRPHPGLRPCAGYEYIRRASRHSRSLVRNWGVEPDAAMSVQSGPRACLAEAEGGARGERARAGRGSAR